MTGSAFVTGGSGFVGSALVSALVRRGREVRALARSDEATAKVRGAGAVPIRGELFDRGAVLEAMRGCSAVFHVAGVNRMCMRDPRSMVRTNVEGTAAIVRAAAAASVPRVVVTSSAAAIGEAEGTIATEESPHRGWFLSEYERSKFLAERRALGLGEQLGLPVVCVNPTSVQGPGRLDGSARLVLDIVNGRLPVLVDTWLSVVDIEDCTAAHLLAETHGVPGNRYLVNGASIRLRAAVELLRATCGRPRRTWFAPRALARLVGPISAPLRLLARDGPALCPESVRTLLHGHRFDASKAERELGLRTTPLEETLRRTLSWYAARGLTPAPSD